MNGFLLCAHIDLKSVVPAASSCVVTSLTLAAPDLSVVSAAWRDGKSLNVAAVSMPMVAACFEEFGGDAPGRLPSSR